MMTTSVKILVFIIAPITVGIFVLATPITAVIYERGEFNASDTALTATALSRYAIGMVFLAANEVLVKSFFADGDTKVPMYSSIAAMVLNVALVTLTSDALGVGGIALASGIAMILNFAINCIVKYKRDGELFSLKDVLDFAKSVASAVIMGLVISLLSGISASPLLTLIICVPVGMIVYAISTVLMRSEETRYFFAMLRRKS